MDNTSNILTAFPRAYLPNGDYTLVSGVRLIDNQGQEGQKNYIIIDAANGKEWPIVAEGDGQGEAPVLSAGIVALHELVVKMIDDAYVNGQIATLGAIRHSFAFLIASDTRQIAVLD